MTKVNHRVRSVREKQRLRDMEFTNSMSSALELVPTKAPQQKEKVSIKLTWDERMKQEWDKTSLFLRYSCRDNPQFKLDEDCHRVTVFAPCGSLTIVMSFSGPSPWATEMKVRVEEHNGDDICLTSYVFSNDTRPLAISRILRALRRNRTASVVYRQVKLAVQ